MAKKLVDTWKTKRWYTVLAPKMFNEAEVNQVPAQDDTKLINRVITIPLKDITKDIAHLYTTVRMRVSEIKGNTAYTKFIGSELAREYVATLVRRYRDKLDVVVDLKSKDGVDFTVKAVIITQEHASTPQKKALHNFLMELLRKKAADTDFGPFVLDVIYGKYLGELQQLLHKIAPVRRVELTKTVLTEWFDTETNMPLPEAPKPEPEPQEEGAQAPAEGSEAPSEAPAEETQ